MTLDTSSSAIDKTTSVLIADDVDLAGQRLRKVLYSLGFRIMHVVGDGKQALQAFTDLEPQLVFLDIEMPHMNGLEVLTRMREADPLAADGRSTFIVIVSAHSTMANIKQALATGANGFILKPYTDRKIAEMIEKFHHSCDKK